ncbi:hypothetical protein, unlikely [Trypanosoma congolense IL3000]|uniref:Uncharacterized protein n=1 Tax=Trypanosoma congolense (strain IL3000) TaxID=1068625 RepID=F9WFR5_TRYCI|nr:hypothetical protein, unlikely [Trypanosoma congolense IL3000]
MRRIEKVGREIRSVAGKPDKRDTTHVASSMTLSEEKKLMGNVRDLRLNNTKKTICQVPFAPSLFLGLLGVARGSWIQHKRLSVRLSIAALSHSRAGAVTTRWPGRA